ncbi:Ig-like domain-containing protein [Morganella psychrotolerans]|uniref:Ig-like domain-containing protein n=1 Tax=Morganella psychrotolerans TaxID=368603 RepID=UPI0039AED9A3
MADQKFEITLRVPNDNAQANGYSENIVEAYFIESETQEPATKLDVSFRVDGNATIKESNGPFFRTSTDGNGKAIIHITNTAPEKVTVDVAVIDDPNQKESTQVTFLASSDKLKITSVYNRNHTFTAEQPTIAWTAASFIIETNGGSGDLKWAISGAVAEAEVESLNNYSAGVTIKSHPYQPVKITVTDNITKEQDEFSFFIKLYIEPSLDIRRTLNQAISQHGEFLLSPFDYMELHKEWGDITVFPEWSLGTGPEPKESEETDADVNVAEFWTSEYQHLGKATVANIKDGTLRDSDHGAFTKRYHAYRSGRFIKN